MQKTILILLVMLVLAAAYSVVSLNSADDIEYNNSSEVDSTNTNKINPQKESEQIPSYLPESNSPSFDQDSHVKLTKNSNTLPYTFTVVGIRLPLEEKNYNNDDKSLVLIKFKNELFEYNLHDFLFDSDMQLVKIEELQISVEYKGSVYLQALTQPNILSKDFRQAEKPFSELIEMTANEIGSRPRIIEHLLQITPTPYIADGVIIGPGLNPALFSQAGFHTDDVLKSINGKSVTVDSELDEIKQELKTAQTLAFLVTRKGREITLYLDIPSETLEISRD